MVKKSNVIILIILLVVLSIVFAYSFGENQGNDSSDVKRLVVSSGMYKLTDFIGDVENKSYYAGYDNETLGWMKSLGDKSVFNGNGFIVIMDSHDAAKLKCEDVTDVYIEQYFDCVILENHSLGNVKNPRDVLLVKNVKYVGENITDLQ
ncbi:MAG: hypothetical protein J6M08_00790 [Methanobrevibacter sp.]|nr:hypothetical protein [Methanobrevibacter sp.]